MNKLPIPVEIERLSDTLFQRLRRTGHPIAEFGGWTLNLESRKSLPPPKSRGRVSTNYRHFDPGNDQDLRSTCRDFVRCAVYSVRMTGKHHELEIITSEAQNAQNL